MRIATLTGLLVCASATAAAQTQPRPVDPASGVGAALDVRYQRVTDIGQNDLHAGQLGVDVQASWAPNGSLEIGAGWGVRASHVAIVGLGSRTRVGLPPLRIWAGTGSRFGRWALGLRFVTGASPALVGAEDAASNGEWAFLAVEGGASHHFDTFDFEAWLIGDAAYAGSTAFSGVGRLEVAFDGGPRAWFLRPHVAGTIVATTDLGWGGELWLGFSATFNTSSLRLVVGLTPPADPSANLVRVRLMWNLDLATARPMRTAEPKDAGTRSSSSQTNNSQEHLEEPANHPLQDRAQRTEGSARGWLSGIDERAVDDDRLLGTSCAARARAACKHPRAANASSGRLAVDWSHSDCLYLVTICSQ